MRHIVPKKSGVHRAACFALYRSLLRHGSKLPQRPLQAASSPASIGVSSSSTELVRGTLRKIFHQNARIQSPRDIVTALRLGYEALSTFQRLSAAAAKTPEIYVRLEGLFQRLPWPRQRKLKSTAADGGSADLPPQTAEYKSNSVTQKHTSAPNAQALPPRPRQQQPASHPVRAPSSPPPRVWPHPDATPVLSRPLPRSHLSGGKRNVPILVHTAQMPFLRLQKPQPAFLSRLIDDRKKQWQKWIDRSQALARQRVTARAEDAWDRCVAAELEVEDAPGKVETEEEEKEEDEPSWEDAVLEAAKQTGARMAAFQERRVGHARRLWEVLLKERELKHAEEGVLVPLTRKARPGEIRRRRKQSEERERRKREGRDGGEGRE